MTFSTPITNGHPATTTVIAPAAVALLLLHRRPQPARPPNGPPVCEFGLVTDVQAADSGEGTRSIMWRPLGLPVCRLLAARVRPAAFEPVATTTCARALARNHHQWSRQSTLERRRPPGILAHFERLPTSITWLATVASDQAARCAHERSSPLCVLLPARTCPRLGAPRARHDRAVDARLGRGVGRGGRGGYVAHEC